LIGPSPSARPDLCNREINGTETPHTIVAAFQAMIRKKSLADLEPWLERARSSLVAAFANGVAKDRAAVSAAISSTWSNGQTEGQITKLKLVKRQMYGRGKIDLLQARVIGAG
ncbi:transposase, partial [Agrobacterium vitis]